MNRPSNHLAGWQKAAAHSAGIALLMTGAAWLALHYGAGAGAGDLPHPLESWTMRLHGLAALAGVFMLGVLAAGHVTHGWRHTASRQQGSQRQLGIALCALGAGLALSGYALMYLIAESWRPALGWAHAAAGAAMAVVLIVHRRAGARQRHRCPIIDQGA